MSRSSNKQTGRSRAVAAIIALAALALPAPGHAQSAAGERALLNRVAVPGGAVAARALRLAAAHPDRKKPVDGQWALTARIGYAPLVTADPEPLAAEALARAEITGARALMGTVAPGPRR